MTNKFYVRWVPDRNRPKHFIVQHYYADQVAEEIVKDLPYFELHEEYSEDFQYQENVLRSIRLIDNLYYFEEAVLPYIKEYKNIKINNLREK